jgi:hypothetical protein
MTTPDSRFFAISAPLKQPLANRDQDLVVQYSVRFTKGAECGGAYIKLLPASSASEMATFSGQVRGGDGGGGGGRWRGRRRAAHSMTQDGE